MEKETLKAMGIEEDKNACKKCGKKLGKEDYVFMGYCEKCYNKVNHIETESNEYVESYIGVNIICFLIPFIGLMGYVTHIKNDYSLAKKCLNSALCGIAIYIILIVFLIFNNM